MTEKIETDWERRLQAEAEAIELLDRSGFHVHDFEIEEEATDSTFGVDVTLSVGEMTYPLESLSDESDNVAGGGFLLGLQTGMLISAGGFDE